MNLCRDPHQNLNSDKVLFRHLFHAQKAVFDQPDYEYELLFSILKEGKSEEEIRRMNQTIDFARNILARNAK